MKREGECRDCPRPVARPGVGRCGVCLAKSNARNKAWRAKHPGNWRRWQKPGLCTRCIKVPPADGHTKCEPCLKNLRDAARARQAALGLRQKQRHRLGGRIVEYLLDSPMLKNCQPEVRAWMEAHADLFHDKGDPILWHSLPLVEERED